MCVLLGINTHVTLEPKVENRAIWFSTVANALCSRREREREREIEN